MSEISYTTAAKELPFVINGEKFSAWQVPGMVFMDLIGKITEEGSEQEQAAAMFEVFKSTMEEEEFARFAKFARNPRNGVSADVLFDLITKLVEGSQSRPTEQPSPSGEGQLTSVASSEAAPS